MNERQPHGDEWLPQRDRMIEEQIRARGISDARVLDAMHDLPREEFLPPQIREYAYEDRALPIGHGQTISQPYIAAYMTEKLELTPDCRVLEIGTGTGYQTALLALLCDRVYTVERIGALQREAGRVLAAMEINNVTLSGGDGSLGLAAEAPFDRILVTAAAPEVPPTLVEQLTDGGRLVIPVGGRKEQTIVVVTRKDGRIVHTPMLACRFVKLIGAEGWSPDGSEC